MKIKLKKIVKMFLLTLIMPIAFIIAVVNVIIEERKYDR